jgi:hypothetical protein
MMHGRSSAERCEAPGGPRFPALRVFCDTSMTIFCSPVSQVYFVFVFLFSRDLTLVVGPQIFDITRYLPFHPGGPDELMRAAGEDASSLIEEVHSWVRVEDLLKVRSEASTH